MFVDLDYKINIIKFMTEKILNRSPLPEEVKKNNGKELTFEILKQKNKENEKKIEKIINPLPVEARTDTCSFIGAMMEVQEGGKVTRLIWDDKNIYILKKDGYLMIYRKNKYYNWVISEVDMNSDDWIIV